ncbi:hypothetical protein [Vibrio crassostreae]|uniref:hypothetical protein n=1 Tax=Vibrio crassostreae TaxID=246167 RepID=UPI001B316824|nr:hypothetical protein [Vibrio crassostreae]
MNLMKTVKVTIPYQGFTRLQHKLFDCVCFVSNVGGGVGGSRQVNYGEILEEEHDRIKIFNLTEKVEMYVYRNALVSQKPMKILEVVYKTGVGTQVRYYRQPHMTKLVMCGSLDTSNSNFQTELEKLEIWIYNYD